MRTLLGLAALAAFVAYCFTREPGVASPGERRAAPPGDGERRSTPRPPPPRHVHAGDPTVRH